MVRELFEPYRRQADIYRKIGTDFTEKNVSFLPKRNPTLEPPSGTVPVFNHPFTGQTIIPEFRGKVDLQLQDLNLFTRPTTKVEYQEDNCGFVIRAVGNDGGVIKKLDIALTYRDPKPECQPPPPPLPPPPPPSDNGFIPYTFRVVAPPGVTCSISWAMSDYTNGKYDFSTDGDGVYEALASGEQIPGYLIDSYPLYIEKEFFLTPETITTSSAGVRKRNVLNRISGENFQVYTYNTIYYSDEPGVEQEIDLPLPAFCENLAAGYHLSQVKYPPWRVVHHTCELPRIPTPPPPTPPPPPPPMSCCPNVEQSDQLLRLILKRIGEPKEVVIFDEDLDRKGAQKTKKKPESLNEYFKLAIERTEIVSRIIGIENFPITVPDTVIEPHKEGIFAKVFDFIDGDKKRKIKTIAEFIAWMAEQDSAVLGEFHQVIEHETDGKDKGGKPVKKTIVLPNVAESLKEIVILTAQMAKQNNVQTEVIFKLLFELIATRAEATKASAIAQDIQDYLDYPTESKTLEYNSTVSLPNIQINKNGQAVATQESEDHKKLLKSGKIKIVYEDWTGDSSLHDQMLDLLQLAAMMRAIYYQRTDK